MSKKKKKEKIKLKISKDDQDVGYLYLPDHPGPGTLDCASKQIDLNDLIKYAGPSIYFDLDKDNNLIGIEILA